MGKNNPRMLTNADIPKTDHPQTIVVVTCLAKFHREGLME